MLNPKFDPFRGKTRLDRLDLLAGTVVEDRNRLVWLECIKNAVHTYRDFGLRDGMTVTDFFDAYWYLFQVRSTDPKTWGELNGLFAEADIMEQCFDVHYERAGLATHCTMSRFLNKIQEDRKELLQVNWGRVLGFLHREQEKDLKNVASGHQLTLPLVDVQKVLLEPKVPAELAELFYFPTAMLKPTPAKRYKEFNAERFNSFWKGNSTEVVAKPRTKTRMIPGQMEVLNVEETNLAGIGSGSRSSTGCDLPV